MNKIIFITIIILTMSLIIGCLQQSIESTTPIKKPEKAQEEQEKTGEECTTGWKCLDKNRKGYQFSNCVFTQVNICKHGCKDGECLPAQPEEKKEETFTLTKGMGRIEKLGWKSCDFSEEQIFEDGVTDQDFKIKLYASSSGYNYFRVESSRASIWIIDKAIAEATRSDCMEKIADANKYNYLRTKQTVCILTKEKNIALVGGYWDGMPAEDTKLHWKYYS